MTPDDIHGYLALFRDSRWLQLTVTAGPDSLYVSRESTTGRTGAAVPKPPGSPPVPEVPASIVVKSPSVGLLRLSRHPTAAPAEGGHVTAGSWLADVIVAGRVEPVLSPADGTVTSRLAADGDPVEYNQPLVVVQPVAAPARPSPRKSP